MKRIKLLPMSLITVLGISVLAILFSCHQPTGGGNPAVFENTAVPETLTLRLSFNRERYGAEARTVRPSLDLLDFEKITVSLYEDGALAGEQTINTNENTGAGLSVRFELRGAGNYTFEVEGFVHAPDTYPAIRGQGAAAISEENFASGVNVTVSMAVSDEACEAGGTGGIELSVNWPDEETLTLDAALYEPDMTTLVREEAGIPRPAVIRFNEVPAGNYFLVMKLKRGDVTAGFFVEAVTVIPGLISNRWAGLDNVETDSRDISPNELRNSSVNLRGGITAMLTPDTVLPLIQAAADADNDLRITAGPVPAGSTVQLKIPCFPGQSISPLTITGGGTPESIAASAVVLAQGSGIDYIFEFEPGGAIPVMTFTVYSSDGSGQKTYTIQPAVPGITVRFFYDVGGDADIILTQIDGTDNNLLFPPNIFGVEGCTIKLQIIGDVNPQQTISSLFNESESLGSFSSSAEGWDFGDSISTADNYQFLYFSITADGETKTYTVFVNQPVAKLAKNGETTYHTTVASAFSAIGTGETGTVTLLKNVETLAGFGTAENAAIPISNKTVTLTAQNAPSAMIKLWSSSRLASLFEIMTNGQLNLQGTPSAALTLDGGSGAPVFRQRLIIASGSGSQLTMGPNVFLQNNRNSGTDHNDGGAVLVNNNAVFTMSGGAIQNNRGQYGGAVKIEGGGRFIMQSGEIANNTAHGGGAVNIGDTTSTFEMSNGWIHNNTCSTASTSGDTGAVRVEAAALFDFSGGTIGGNTNYRNAGIYLHPNGGLGRLSMSGNATVNNNDRIYLANSASDTAWASITVPAPFTGAARLVPQTRKSGVPIVRGDGGHALASAEVMRFTFTSSENARLVYEVNEPNNEGRLAWKYFISQTGSPTGDGTTSSPYRMPKQALDNVLPGGTAELNFYNMVVRENVAELMSAVRTGSEDSVQVWMNVDENRKITLSGKPGVNSGFDGGSVSDNFPALWIGGGAHVTLKNGMIIKGASCYEYTVPQGELALVTIYNGTLAIEDSAQVVTTTNGIGYNQADSLKTIGVQYNWESFQGHIEVNSLLTSTSVMFVQPVNDYGHCIGNADNCIGKVVLIGSAVADNFGRFDIYYDTDVMAAANETYTFDGTGCIYRIYLY